MQQQGIKQKNNMPPLVAARHSNGFFASHCHIGHFCWPLDSTSISVFQ